MRAGYYLPMMSGTAETTYQPYSKKYRGNITIDGTIYRDDVFFGGTYMRGRYVVPSVPFLPRVLIVIAVLFE
jgi:hypothetical protein